ncbi:MAG TPA: hypothetical protein VJY36_07810 [Candidatus Bathyarchaeia archaeon]|nr:hypothetical protein [Candidatus Bathyarchaeia archaeon]
MAKDFSVYYTVACRVWHDSSGFCTSRIIFDAHDYDLSQIESEKPTIKIVLDLAAEAFT